MSSSATEWRYASRRFAATYQVRKGRVMARRTVVVSDLSGKTIEDGKGAKIRITFADARRGSYELDVTDDEGVELGRKGRATARRGRRPKGAA